MKALTYHGSKDVRVETVPDPQLVEADDILLRVTATAICGSDLHLFHGKIPETRHGDIFGHEFMGVVEDAGSAVTEVSVGDRVVIPFVIACGKCFFCENELFAACETTNPDEGASVRKRSKMTPPAALFGYSHLYGGVPGGQAEYVRVPKANVGPFAVPGSLADEKVLFLSDILPTGYQAVLNARVEPGSTVAIFGAGPVGLMAAACARMLGAERIFMVDSEQYRLNFAVSAYGVIPIDFSEGDASERILEATNGRGVSASIDAVGFEAKGSTTETVLSTLKIETSSGEVIRQCISATQRGGVVSVPGVYAGFIHGFLIGDAFDKGLSFAMGQTHVHKYLPELLGFIEDGDLDPDIIISHRMKLADAAQGYKIFDEKREDCRKVVMTP
ncbi:zinc-dependent alcohol dehydrogenase [Pseudoxanthomonas winnipegensis]|jgi:threonine dehydrogenase-like Zn-dependent dehydrogenase|uniref:Glutathione-dependent formaldehyde dehydrogenase n=1 Tax=Pseudoxanthomonas winnipegensis TaxID=2480810 RepID=A0A4Q8LYU4_9GAMM|nr:zinc-dependent alcohol dehydrogenase [Pseudoxanthomonas winnipegensis]RZZ86991.1 glutathione-dependent formaldehyde dehydrogenase [Pseudoxanthomonas winnipegensis]TAA07173.1 glutathione-dependent formaldehyde dehydrogenase [Pseudoxanthomonas winnipegensis]TAA20814.1 glutathione-dependent formaldehyde dehydrogenase [Pseudoxanthomonas winnipegensis]TAA37793.1 glutathione-dependent formaldehyde dehydrogenase [Pseudoxanthomonas winnipegensis]TAH72284.1 glutathione-dependent formaldehyde dehydro